jgi:hypothetical protein
MHATRQSLPIGEPPQQQHERLPFGGIKFGNEVLLVLRRQLPGLAQGSTPLLGQVHGVRSAIARVGLTLSKTEPFEIIDDCHHGVAVRSNRVRDPLLSLSLVTLEEGQDPDVRRRESKRRRHLSGLGRNVKTQL